MWAAFDFSTMFVALLVAAAFHFAAIWRAKCCFLAFQVVLKCQLRQSRSTRASIGGGSSVGLALDSGGFLRRRGCLRFR